MKEAFDNVALYSHTLHVRNVNEALPLGLQLLQRYGNRVVSRGMATIEFPGPVLTVYRKPDEKVLLCPVRDANPFFHFFESLWILSGSRTVNVPAAFLGRITDYSDDGHRFHGAYGHRLRHAFGFDQIEKCISLLTLKPDTRQAVMSIWKPDLDLGATTKDIPCNDMIMFKVRDDYLHMTVLNRSNDVIWGAYGANAVQFAVLQEYIAARLGVDVGYYTQSSDSYHVYEDNPLWQKYVSGAYAPSAAIQPYDRLRATPMFRSGMDAMMAYEDAVLFNRLLEEATPVAVLRTPRAAFKSTLFRDVALPMLMGYLNYKAGDTLAAAAELAHIVHDDWRKATQDWVWRRHAAKGAA